LLHKNSLSNIDDLAQFQNLKVIDASNNYIHAVDLPLPKLEHLNLSNNYLVKFPSLDKSLRLRYINLETNRLEDLKGVKVNFTPNIKILNLGYNNISFEKSGDFRDFLEVITKLKSL
jgi:Leucine-rich repeat (LRR) protein